MNKYLCIGILQVGLLNVDEYYDSLLSFIDKAVEEGFISPTARHIIVSAPTAKELVKKLEVILICVCICNISCKTRNLWFEMVNCGCRSTCLVTNELLQSSAGRRSSWATLKIMICWGENYRSIISRKLTWDFRKIFYFCKCTPYGNWYDPIMFARIVLICKL